MTECIKKYERSVKKALHCSSATKAKLLDGFRATLNAFSEENPSPDAQALYEAFGPPEEMAKLLMESTTEADRAQYRRNKLFLRIGVVILIATIILFTIYVCFVKSNPVQYYNDFTITETQASPPIE